MSRESELEAAVVRLQRERDELGPLFIRDMCRLLAVDETDSFRLDKLAEALQAALRERDDAHTALRVCVRESYNLITQGESPTQRRQPSAQRIYEAARAAVCIEGADCTCARQPLHSTGTSPGGA